MKRVLNLAACLLPLMAGAVAAQDILPVEVVSVETVPRSRDYRLTGTIEPAESYSAGFRDGGRVISVSVDVGDVLRPGDEIARVDPTQTNASLNAAQASLDAAQAALTQAEQARDRAQGLLDRGSGTQADLDSAKQSYLTALASRDQASAQLASAQRAAEDTVLKAVEAAVVTERTAEPGQVVSAGQGVVTLASESDREAVFLMPDLKNLDELLGRDVVLTPIDGGESLIVPVTEISPVVESNGTVTAKARITGDHVGKLTFGEPVIGEITHSGAQIISVPWSAMSASAEGPAVWLLDPDTGKVSLRQIVVDAYTRDAVEVSDGLEDGDVVVAQGSHALFPGRTVSVKEARQ